MTEDRYSLRPDNHNCFSVVDSVTGAPAKLGPYDLAELLSSEANEMLQSLNKLDDCRRRFQAIIGP